jgi:ribosomal protein L7/L12
MARPVSDAESAQIRTEILAGRKIEAIKLYRQATGEGLKEAKDFIEAVQAELWEREPQSFKVPLGKGGCRTPAAVLLLLLAIIMLAII